MYMDDNSFNRVLTTSIIRSHHLKPKIETETQFLPKDVRFKLATILLNREWYRYNSTSS